MRRPIVIAWTLLVVPAALAKKPEDVFKRQVLVVTKRIPFRFASDAAMISFFRGNRAEHVWPDKDAPDESRWSFEFMSFFAEPLNDLQVQVKFSDLTEGRPRFVNAYDQMTSDRGQRILASRITLEKPEFAANRKYKMQIVSRGKELAATTFWLRGKREVYSGRVKFTDEEAAGGGP